ncbi:MAG: FAD binding domain-containing protein [Deltaproteobacteria bacterium]|nr:FAD binding domain-containing protein [Deltaproteobacteria bacterium]
MMPFDHVNAGSPGEAVDLLTSYGGKGRLIAGGTDVLGILKDRILPDYPDVLINLKTIPGMDSIKESGEGLNIGALAKLADIASSPEIKAEYPALSLAAESVASPEIRTMATIGGNLCQDVRCWYYRYPHHMGGRMLCFRKGVGPCYAVKGDNRYHAVMGGKKCFAVCPSDTAIALCALQAKISIFGGEGTRTLPLEKFFTPMGNVLRSNELVKEILIPKPTQETRQAFIKFTERKPVDFAVASIACVLEILGGRCMDARIYLGGVAPMPWHAEAAERIIKGGSLDDPTAEEAALASVAGAKPLKGNAYKIEIVKALVKRALLRRQ